MSPSPPVRRPLPWRRLWIRFVWTLAAVSVAVLVWGWRAGRLGTPFWIQRLAGPFAAQTADGVHVAVYASRGLRTAPNLVTLVFTDARTGAPLAVGKVSFELTLHSPESVTSITSMVAPVPGDIGRYRTRLNLDTPGLWNAQVSFQNAHGAGTFGFPVTVSPP